MNITRTERNQRFTADGTLIAEQVIEVDVTEPENRRTLTERAATAMQSNRDYLALVAPTAAQSREQVERLTRQVQALIRLTIGALDDTD